MLERGFAPGVEHLAIPGSLYDKQRMVWTVRVVSELIHALVRRFSIAHDAACASTRNGANGERPITPDNSNRVDVCTIGADELTPSGAEKTRLWPQQVVRAELKTHKRGGCGAYDTSPDDSLW